MIKGDHPPIPKRFPRPPGGGKKTKTAPVRKQPTKQKGK